MMTAVRQTVTVQAAGRVEFVAPELTEGTVTEVIVLVPEEQPAAMTPEQRIAKLDTLRARINLTEEQAEAWMSDVTAERKAWRLPGEELAE